MIRVLEPLGDVVVDLFGGVGGAGMGYRLAGLPVRGADIVDQPRYPFPFVQADALAILVDLIQQRMRGERPRFMGRRVALVHASPPCQASCALTKGTNRAGGATERHVDLIPATRELLKLTGLPYVIENVQGAKVRRDLTLCGEMFGLDVIRHRYFEVDGFSVTQPTHVKHRGRVRGWRHGRYFDGPYVAVYGDGGGKGSVAEWQHAMGIGWTDERAEIAEAIPPAYTQLIGEQYLAQQREVAAA